MFDQKMLVHLFRGQVKAPKIPIILAGGILLGLIHNSQVNVVRVRRGHAGKVEDAEGNRFVKPMLAASMEASLLNASAQVELAPFGLVWLAEIVACLQMMAAIEIKLPHVLAHGVTPFAAARAKANVIINLAACDGDARVADAAIDLPYDLRAIGRPSR